MGTGKQFSGILIRRRRRLVFLALIISSLVLGLILQGCDGGTEAEIPPVAVEAVVAEATPDDETPSEETEELVEGAVWCNPDIDLYAELPGLGDISAEGIFVELCIPGMAGVYTLEFYEGELADITSTKELESPFPIHSLLTFFKVKSGDNVITSFSPALQLRITYTGGPWNSIEEREYEQPRVAYLQKTTDGWAQQWFEFEAPAVFPPGNESNPEGTGVLIITIEELPDPLIGGC